MCCPGFANAVKGTPSPGCVLMHEVAEGDDPDQVPVIANHGHAADTHSSHPLEDFFAGFVGTASLDVNGHGI
jgi:hypothetical protein